MSDARLSWALIRLIRCLGSIVEPSVVYESDPLVLAQEVIKGQQEQARKALYILRDDIDVQSIIGWKEFEDLKAILDEAARV